MVLVTADMPSSIYLASSFGYRLELAIAPVADDDNSSDTPYALIFGVSIPAVLLLAGLGVWLIRKTRTDSANKQSLEMTRGSDVEDSNSSSTQE